MTKGTRDYKRLESMLKENDQKREKDLARVEARLDTTLEDIKSLIHGIIVQHNELRSQMTSQEGGRANRRSILGNPMVIQGDFSGQTNNTHPFRYATKMEFPRFNGE